MADATETQADPDEGFADDLDGESVEDRAAAGEEDKPQEPTLPGTVARQLSLEVGGEEPDSSSFKMRGGSIAVEGEFVKGDTLKVEVTLSVDEVHFIDRKDGDGYVVGTERRHIAKPLSIRRITQ